ncbi:hypothetical protein AVEN_122749-1 [Araneus ventricosus]|uniref:Uncharacterized protein n=1 Tax=Araneus ventricosus TaxID=182803 RepID=A0A4Y2NCA3_ARAVE|nr:hypothetical protein AVEN_122749-1 [Araneus ventricosus]
MDSPNLGGHLPHHPCYNLPLRHTEMGCGLQGYLDTLQGLSPKRSQNLPSKEANRLKPAFFAVKGKYLDGPGRLAWCQRVNVQQAQYTEDFQWNRISNRESLGHKSETLPQCHLGLSNYEDRILNITRRPLLIPLGSLSRVNS